MSFELNPNEIKKGDYMKEKDPQIEVSESVARIVDKLSEEGLSAEDVTPSVVGEYLEDGEAARMFRIGHSLESITEDVRAALERPTQH